MPTILYAEDDAEQRTLIDDLLATTNISLIQAVNGQDAVKKITATRPDLILLDLFMPVMDGFAVIRAVKANPDTRHIPILVLSAWPTGDNRLRAQEAGAADFIVKPYDTIKLLETIQGYLRGELPRQPIKSDTAPLGFS